LFDGQRHVLVLLENLYRVLPAPDVCAGGVTVPATTDCSRTQPMSLPAQTSWPEHAAAAVPMVAGLLLLAALASFVTTTRLDATKMGVHWQYKKLSY